MPGHPAVYMWVVVFEDNSALSQYDPETGRKNPQNPDWLKSKMDSEGYVIVNGKRMKYRDAYPMPDVYKGRRVIRAGWVPFPLKLARRIWHMEGIAVIPTLNKAHWMDLRENEQLRMHFTQLIRYMRNTKKIISRETEYVLGVMDGEVMRIKEDGSIG